MYTPALHPLRPSTRPAFPQPCQLRDRAPSRPIPPPSPRPGVGLRSQARPAPGRREINRAAGYGARPILEPSHLDQTRGRADVCVPWAAHEAAGASGGFAPAAGDYRCGREPKLRRLRDFCFVLFCFFLSPRPPPPPPPPRGEKKQASKYVARRLMCGEEARDAK